MSATIAQRDLVTHLQAMPSRPAVAYPNGPIVTDMPRIVVEVPQAAQRTKTIAGIQEVDAEIVARIETQDGHFETEATDIAEAIVAHFAPGTKAGVNKIIDAPSVRSRFRRDGVYYLPLIIRGRSYF